MLSKLVNDIKIDTESFDKLMRVWKALHFDAMGFSRRDLNDPKMRAVFNLTLRRGYSVPQLFVLVYCHFEWRGPSGIQEREHNTLIMNGFMLESFIKNISSYAAYCERTLTPERWNNEKELLRTVNFWNEKLFSFPTV